MLLRVVNGFFAALLAVLTLVSLAFVGRGSQGVWIAAGWGLLFALLAILAFVNMRRAPGGDSGRGLIALNAAAALPLLAGAVLLGSSQRLLCATAALPFALTALLLALRRAKSG